MEAVWRGSWWDHRYSPIKMYFPFGEGYRSLEKCCKIRDEWMGFVGYYAE